MSALWSSGVGLPLPLTLVFFLHLLTAALISSKYRNILPTDRLYHASVACQPSQRITFTSKTNTPQKTLSNPHFSSRQLLSPFSSSAFAHRAAEQAFNNAPRTPPKHLERSQALSATVLEQQDRLPKTISVTDALAVKSTSALLYLWKEDVKRYWSTLRSGSSSGEIEGHDGIVASNRLVVPGRTGVCADGFPIEGFCSRESTRSHSDILVVGIVVLFLVAVVAWEAAETIGNTFVPLSIHLLFPLNRVDNICVYKCCGILQKTTLRQSLLRR